MATLPNIDLNKNDSDHNPLQNVPFAQAQHLSFPNLFINLYMIFNVAFRTTEVMQKCEYTASLPPEQN